VETTELPPYPISKTGAPSPLRRPNRLLRGVVEKLFTKGVKPLAINGDKSRM
jgi:hypothetical protein